LSDGATARGWPTPKNPSSNSYTTGAPTCCYSTLPRRRPIRWRWCAQVKRDSEIKHIAIVALVDARDAAGLDFSVGLEDFIVKNESFEELETRIKFVLWRLSKVDSKDTVKAGALVMNLASYQVSVSGQQIELTYKEYELLRFLLTHRGRVFSRDALLRHVWGEEYLGGTRTVDVHIRRLRAKIGTEFDELIQTVRNVGYKFIEENKS
jgi:DNA-binding response OmpR family regulator